jgi:type IX secretion system PorP/SprF family membrane protein
MNKNKTIYNMPNLRCIMFAVAVALQFTATAQQEPMSAQYIMNKLFVNPAYAGYKEQTQFVAMHRSQWIGFEGAPMTSVLSFDMPLKQNEFALGPL